MGARALPCDLSGVPERRALIITADDYGYSPRYDEGIVEAATARAVDSVSMMVKRGPLDVAPLLATGAELGLHSGARRGGAWRRGWARGGAA